MMGHNGLIAVVTLKWQINSKVFISLWGAWEATPWSVIVTATWERTTMSMGKTARISAWPIQPQNPSTASPNKHNGGMSANTDRKPPPGAARADLTPSEVFVHYVLIPGGTQMARMTETTTRSAVSIPHTGE